MEAIQLIQLNPSQLSDIVTKAVSEGIRISKKYEEDPKHHSKKEAANLTGKSESWIDGQRRTGNLKWFLVGGTVRIPSSEIERILKL